MWKIHYGFCNLFASRDHCGSLKYCRRRGSNLAWELGTLPLHQLDLLVAMCDQIHFTPLFYQTSTLKQDIENLNRVWRIFCRIARFSAEFNGLFKTWLKNDTISLARLSFFLKLHNRFGYTANIFEVIFTVFNCVRISTVIMLYGLHFIAAPSKV